MKKKLFPLLTVAGAALLFAGCESPEYDKGVYLPQSVAVNDLENRTSLVLLSKDVQHSVTCTGLQEMRLPDGRLQVAANLRNRQTRRIQVQANCEFKDAQGFAIDSTPFQNVFMDEAAQETVKFISMNDKAARYTIRIRETR